MKKRELGAKAIQECSLPAAPIRKSEREGRRVGNGTGRGERKMWRVHKKL